MENQRSLRRRQSLSRYDRQPFHAAGSDHPVRRIGSGWFDTFLIYGEVNGSSTISGCESDLIFGLFPAGRRDAFDKIFLAGEKEDDARQHADNAGGHEKMGVGDTI